MDRKRIPNITIIIFLFVGLLGFTAFQFLYDEAFPEASIDLKVSKERAVEKSREFLTDMGFDLTGYRHVVVFNQSQGYINFLERKIGLSKANQVFRETATVYVWQVRWFKELEEIEYSFEITPDGRFGKFNRRYPEKESGERLPREEALKLAEAFIRTNSGIDFDKLEYIEHIEYERPNRMDRSFTWRLKGFDIGDSEYRYSATIQGNQVGKFSQWLRTPEKYDRERSELSDHRRNLNEAFEFLTALLSIGSFVFFIWLAYKRNIRWKVTLVVSTLAGVVAILTKLNNLPFAYLGYSTTESFSSFWIQQLSWSLIAGVGTAFGMLMIFAAADGAGRQYMTDRLQCSGVFIRSFLRSSDLKRQMALGYGMAFAAVGYVTIFYVLGQRYLGAWVPVDVPITNTFSTYFPAMQALYTGFTAAMNEELLFRLFAIAVLLRITKRPWIAIVLPAVAWGFAHTMYPQEPIWIRGVELTLAGIVYGWVFYRYGLLTTLTSHFVYNCFVGVVLQFQSGEISLVLNALAAIMAPVLFLVAMPIFRWIGRNVERLFAKKTGPAVSAEEPAIVPVVASETDPLVRPHSTRFIVAILIISAVVFTVSQLVPFPKFYTDPPAVVLTQQQAYEKCLQYLQEAGVDPEGFTSFTTYKDRTTSLPEYAFDQIGIQKTHDRFADRFNQQPSWYTRWYQEKTIQKYQVGIYDDGRLRYLDIDLADEDTGLTPESRSYLEESEARIIAEHFLRSQNLDLENQWEQIEVDKLTKPNRQDWRFTYRDKTFSLGELEVRRSVKISGDRITRFSTAWNKVPNEWERDRSLDREHLRNTIRSTLSMITFACFFLFIFIQFFLLLGKKMAKKQDLLWAVGGGVIFGILMTAVEQINEIPKFFYGYYGQTEQTIRSYTTGKLVGIPAEYLGSFFGMFFLLLLLQVFLRAWAPRVGSLKQLISPLHPRNWSKTENIQGILLGIALIFFDQGADSIFYIIRCNLFPGTFSPDAVTASKEFYQYSQSLLLFAKISGIVMLFITLPIFFLAIYKFMKKDKWAIPAILLFVILSKGTSSLSTTHMLFSWFADGLEYILIYLAITRILKWNVMPYVIFLWIEAYHFDGIGRFLTSQSEFFWVDVQRITWLVLPITIVLGVGLWQKFIQRKEELSHP